MLLCGIFIIATSGAHDQEGKMEIKKCFFEYLEFIKATKSDGTYRFDLSHGQTILSSLDTLGKRKIRDLNRETLYTLSEIWKARGVCGSTINKRFCLMKRALAYSGVTVKGVSDFPGIKFKTKRFHTVPREDLVKLINHFLIKDHTAPELTRTIVFFLYFYTGCRSNELVHIRIDRIDLETCSISLDFTKTGVPRVVFFDQMLSPYIREYISIRPERDLLFWDFRMNRPFSTGKASSILRYACQKLKIPRVHPHMLRHTFASMMVDNGCPLIALQYILGHANPRQTEQYIHLGSTYLKKSFDDFGPKIE
jgi:integrase/recombinase XerC/integrase/recombinase XerD